MKILDGYKRLLSDDHLAWDVNGWFKFGQGDHTFMNVGFIEGDKAVRLVRWADDNFSGRFCVYKGLSWFELEEDAVTFSIFFEEILHSDRFIKFVDGFERQLYIPVMRPFTTTFTEWTHDWYQLKVPSRDFFLIDKLRWIDENSKGIFAIRSRNIFFQLKEDRFLFVRKFSIDLDLTED